MLLLLVQPTPAIVSEVLPQSQIQPLRRHIAPHTTRGLRFLIFFFPHNILEFCRYAKYNKMLQAGVPEGGIRRHMQTDEILPANINAYFESKSGNGKAAAASAASNNAGEIAFYKQYKNTIKKYKVGAPLRRLFATGAINQDDMNKIENKLPCYFGLCRAEFL